MHLFRWYIQQKKLTVLTAIVWTVIVFVLCLMPSNDIPKIRVPFIDKWTHLLIFAVFSFLWFAVLSKFKAKYAWLLFFATFLTGYIIELLQGSPWVHGRSYELMDVVADSIGGVIGIFIFYFLHRFNR